MKVKKMSINFKYLIGLKTNEHVNMSTNEFRNSKENTNEYSNTLILGC